MVRANLQRRDPHRPGLRNAQLLRSWPAIVNGTDDWRPILGEVPRVRGFWLSLFPWLGFSAGPIAARVGRGAIAGREPEVDDRATSHRVDLIPTPSELRRQGGELVGALAPALVEAHLLVLLAVRDRPVQHRAV